MALKLDKVTRGPHLSTLVASSIAREIAQGRLKPGDQLPTEQSLATTFGVSRNVVREAIARLRSEGRIRSQQGLGAFVAEIPAAALTIELAGSPSAKAFRGLFELRGILEVEAAGLAALRRQPTDIDVLHAKLDAMAEAPYGGVVWLRMDLDFHTAIAAATRNDYIAQVLVFVSEKVRESILASGQDRDSDVLARLTLDEHQRILDAIVEGDAVAAQGAMRQHLKEAAGRLGLIPGLAETETEAEASAELPRGWLEGAGSHVER